jgi:hypothetical protein
MGENGRRSGVWRSLKRSSRSIRSRRIGEDKKWIFNESNPRRWNCNAAVFGDLVFCSGMVADDKSLDMKGQTAQVLRDRCRVGPGRDQQIAHFERDGLHAGCQFEE